MKQATALTVAEVTAVLETRAHAIQFWLAFVRCNLHEGLARRASDMRLCGVGGRFLQRL